MCLPYKTEEQKIVGALASTLTQAEEVKPPDNAVAV